MRLLENCAPPCKLAVCCLALTLATVGCGTDKPASDPPHPTNPPTQPVVMGVGTNSSSFGPLRVGDRVVVEMTGTPETIQPFAQDISADGTISMNYIGHVQAAGKTPGELQDEIQAAYVPAWYKHLSVSVTPPQRFFSVGGQVNKGDRFPWTGPTTVTRAIQAAGGFDPFAAKKKVRLTRVDGTVIIVDCIDVLDHPEKDPPVYPGDKVDVPRRYW
jgi:polysaccharide biosynthesis/export protein VpsN